MLLKMLITYVAPRRSMTQWLNGSIAVWHYGKWKYGKTAVWHNGSISSMVQWQIAIWEYSSMVQWQNSRMTEWQYSSMAHWQSSRMAEYGRIGWRMNGSTFILKYLWALSLHGAKLIPCDLNVVCSYSYIMIISVIKVQTRYRDSHIIG